MRINKGRDKRQKGVWVEHTGKLLEFLRAHSNEQFDVYELIEKVGLSRPTLSKHLCSLESKGDVICDGGRPAKYRLRPFYPMSKQLAEKVQETLASASPDTPPVSLTMQLSDKKYSKTEVTFVPNGNNYSRRFKLTETSAIGNGK